MKNIKNLMINTIPCNKNYQKLAVKFALYMCFIAVFFIFDSEKKIYADQDKFDQKNLRISSLEILINETISEYHSNFDDSVIELHRRFDDFYQSCLHSNDGDLKDSEFADMQARICVRKKSSECIAPAVSLLTSRMLSETGSSKEVLAEILGGLAPGWETTNTKDDQSYLYNQLLEYRREQNFSAARKFDRALMNSRGLFYDGFYMHGFNPRSINEKILMFQNSQIRFPESRFFIYALNAEALAYKELAFYYALYRDGVPLYEFDFSNQQSREYLDKSDLKFEELIEYAITPEGQEWARFAYKARFEIIGNAIARGEYGRAADLAQDARQLVDEETVHIYLNGVIDVSPCPGEEKGLPPLVFVEKEMFANYGQLISELLVFLKRDDVDEINLVEFFNIIENFQNRDYRIFVGSYRDKSEAEDHHSYLEDEVISNEQFMQEIRRVFDGDIASGITDGGRENIFGVWFGEELSLDQAKSIGLLLKKYNIRGSEEAFLWRPNIR